MRNSLVETLRWRLKLYGTVLGLCRQGQFSFARFFALPPERLRLAVGESRANAEVPIAVDSEVRGLAASLHAAWQIQDAPAQVSGDELRQVLRLAQIDGHVDLFSLVQWSRRSGAALVDAVSRTHAQTLRHVAERECGEELAYLAYVAWRAALSREAAATTPAHAALVAWLLEGSAGGTTPADNSNSLSASLGLRIVLTTSPLSLGARPNEVLDHPLNPYRTRPEAVAWVASQLKGIPLEAAELEPWTQSLTAHLLAKPETRTHLAREALFELVRDCALVALAQLMRVGLTPLSKTLRRISGSTQALVQTLQEAPRRQELLGLVRTNAMAGQPPLANLTSLLSQADRALAGSTDALGPHGELTARAQLAALGGIVFALDQHAAQANADIVRRLRWIDEPQARQAEYASGRCYRLSMTGEPLFRSVQQQQEAHLFVDMKDFTSRTAAIKERAMGDFLRRFFYEPIFNLAAQLGGQRTLRVSNILGDAVAFRGDVKATLALAQGIRDILDHAHAKLSADVPQALGGESEAVADIREALNRAETEKAELTRATVHPASPEETRLNQLRLKIASLRENLDTKLSHSRGLGLEAGVYVAFGAAAEHVDLAHPTWGQWSVAIAARLNEAARGTARSAAVWADAQAQLANYRQGPDRSHAQLPFFVRVGQRAQLRLSPAFAEALSKAAFGRDKVGITHVVKQVAQWLNGAVGEASDRDGSVGVIDQSAELYNAGCALSGPALAAYRRACENALIFAPHEIYQRQLPAALLRAFFLEHDPERFLFATRRSDGSPAQVFRFAGKVPMKGFEKEGDIEVWELVTHKPFLESLTPVLKQLAR